MPPKNAPNKVKECEKNKERHPKTRKCVNKCNPGKTRNADFRCTKTKSTHIASPEKKKTSPPAPTKVKDCEKNKERHPKTRKCVNKCNPGKSRNADFRCTKTKSTHIAPPEKKKPVAGVMSDIGKIVFPVPAVDDSTITKKEATSILNLINHYALEGEKYQEKGIAYTNNQVLHNLLYLYLIEKYGSTCFVRGRHVDGHYTYIGLSLGMGETKTDIYKQIKIILNCIKRIQSTPNEIIVIPLTIGHSGSGHANMLIYRKSLNVIEHFEPHGAIFLGNETLPITDYIRYKVPAILETIVDKMNTINKENNNAYYQNNLTYLAPHKVCPASTMGLQELENKLVVSKEVKEREGGGFCAMWSIFWAEMVLLNPHVPTDKLRNYIMDSIDYANLYTKYDKIVLKTRNVIRGYLELVYVQINNMIETIAPGRNMKDLITNAYKEPTKIYDTLFDQIIGNLDSYYNISYHIFGKFNQKQQKDKFKQYLDEQFKKHNEVSYSEHIQKPASKSFSELPL
jgi:hypothetical protein